MKLKKSVWIDLDNSPHVLFFDPLIKQLEKIEIKVILTARDAFQVCDLIKNYNLNAKVIGKHHGKNRIHKITGLFYRAFQLLKYIKRQKPCLALSHGSRSQMIAAKFLGLKSLLIIDYEHAKPLPFFHPDFVLVPNVIPKKEFPFRQNTISYYPGLKEYVYLPYFKPDTQFLTRLGLDEKKIIITIRPPASEAHYHNPKSDVLFKETMNYLLRFPETKIIILPRSSKQKEYILTQWDVFFKDDKIFCPEHAIDGLNLIWNSDLVISGGGTMNREAAVMGVPVYSIFKGHMGHVDKYLCSNELLILLDDPEDIKNKIRIEKRNKLPDQTFKYNDTIKSILDNIVGFCK